MTDETTTVAFGGGTHQCVQIEVCDYEQKSPVREKHDDNWLVVRISARVGGFHGLVEATIFTWELSSLLKQLKTLHERLRGTAEFTSLEQQLRLKFIGDGRGHIELAGDIVDQAGVGNRLTFTLAFDQTELAQSIRQLERITSLFPIR